MSVDIDTESGFSSGNADELFHGYFVGAGTYLPHLPSSRKHVRLDRNARNPPQVTHFAFRQLVSKRGRIWVWKTQRLPPNVFGSR